MISKSVLTSAKAFLCWDSLENLSIQLVPVQNAVAYYYPRQNAFHTIVLFYDESLQDFSKPLFLLFHEVGHAIQWLELKKARQEQHFSDMMDSDKGEQKVIFEQQAWTLGRSLLYRFIDKEDLSFDVLERYDQYGTACVQSYSSM